MVRTSQPVSVWTLEALLGEGPVWVERDQALWLVDIKSRKIHRFHPGSGETKSWDAPGQCSFVLPLAAGGFTVGLQHGVHRFDEQDGSFSLIVDPEPDMPGNRLNDGTVDSQGRLWFGTMDDGEKQPTGAIYRLDSSRKAERVSPFCPITNGPAMSPDGRTLYHVDTLGRLVYACRIADDGSLADREIFLTIEPGAGNPDGPTVDAEGCVWIGLYGGWAARRYSPAGELLEVVEFPIGDITKLAFGGPDLRIVYATSARQGLDAAALERQPEAGNLFSFRADVPGIASAQVVLD